MNQKLLSYLAVAVVVLGVLAWATSKSRYSPVEGGGFVELLDQPVEAGAVQKVRAWLGSAPDSVVELARSGDGWVVASSWGWPAKASLVDALLDDVSGLKGEKRSSSEDVLADYQIDADKGVHIVGEGTGGSELFHLVVGKTAVRGGSFVRRQDSNDVFLAGASLRSSFGVWGDDPKPPEAKRWMELRVHQAERNDVDRLVLHDGDREITLEKVFVAPAADTTGVATPDRSSWTWKDGAGDELDKSKADGVLGTICNLYASDAVPPEDEGDEYGLADPTRSVEVFFQDGTSKTLFFGSNAEEDRKTYARVGEDGLPSLIYKSTVDRLFPKRDELKPKES